MIDVKALREDPDRFKRGARQKRVDVDIERLLRLDEERRRLMLDQETARAEQKRISKEIGPDMGRLKGAIKRAEGDERDALETELRELESRPLQLKAEIQAFDARLQELTGEWETLLLEVPQPPDADVPVGESADDNVEIRRWAPAHWSADTSFADNRGFAPRSHMELMDRHGMVDFERAVRMAGARHYCLVGDGMRLHQAILRYALDLISDRHGFTPVSVPVIVREECMTGTGFFPGGRDSAYHIEESKRGSGHDLFLTGTGEVGLMGFRSGEILDAAELPLQYATVSTCFRREAGAAGKDTAGLYRIHQFDKCEQVVICRADEAESRDWHQRMIGIVEELLQSLELPYRLLQCCTADLGVKNADMIDIECWMPSRGDEDAGGVPSGAWGETHSASRLYDFQCRRLNLRYRDENGKTQFCHSLNNTVAASPRILIPIIEMHQQADGSIAIPGPLRPYMGGRDTIGG
jgi:seryl-tRNA synthetase